MPYPQLENLFQNLYCIYSKDVINWKVRYLQPTWHHLASVAILWYWREQYQSYYGDARKWESLWAYRQNKMEGECFYAKFDV